MGDPRIGFRPNVAALTSEGKKQLDRVYNAIKDFPAAPITVAGYTTLAGKNAMKLVQARADTAAQYLRKLGLQNTIKISDKENVNYIGVIVSVTGGKPTRPAGCK